mmetsp:Transcript_2576/g.10224  ORF Transcript_2576/g.10224 Transcript_2576/m.10224 type:complete len:508 (+) Transcript_2576:1079-2602(+)
MAVRAKSVVGSATDDLLAAALDHDGVLVLGSVGPHHVTQRRVGVHEAGLAKVAQCAHVALLLAAGAVQKGAASVVALQPATAESERAKRLGDVGEQVARALEPQGGVGRVNVLHVVRALQVLVHLRAAVDAAEGLDGEKLPCLHAGGVAVGHDGHGLAGVDLVRRDGVAIEVLNGLDRVEPAGLELHFEALHDFLNLRANVAEGHVHARGADSRLSGLAHSLEEGVKAGIERDRPRGVDDVAVDLRAKVHLHHIAGTELSVVAAVGRVVCRHVVETAAGGEGDAALQAALADQLPVLVLERLAHVPQLDAGLDQRRGEGASLAMHFGAFTEGKQASVGLFCVHLARLRGGHAGRRLGELHVLPFRERHTERGKELSHRHGGRLGLAILGVVVGEVRRLDATVLGLLLRLSGRASGRGGATLLLALAALALALLLAIVALLVITCSALFSSIAGGLGRRRGRRRSCRSRGSDFRGLRSGRGRRGCGRLRGFRRGSHGSIGRQRSSHCC